MYSLSGFDGAIHLSEEVKDAATTIPKVIFLSIIINGSLAFGILIALLFAIGNIKQALYTPTLFPIIEIFRQASGSNAGKNPTNADRAVSIKISRTLLIDASL